VGGLHSVAGADTLITGEPTTVVAASSVSELARTPTCSACCWVMVRISTRSDTDAETTQTSTWDASTAK